MKTATNFNTISPDSLGISPSDYDSFQRENAKAALGSAEAIEETVQNTNDWKDFFDGTELLDTAVAAVTMTFKSALEADDPKAATKEALRAVIGLSFVDGIRFAQYLNERN